jgi:hypothetical protein
MRQLLPVARKLIFCRLRKGSRLRDRRAYPNVHKPTMTSAGTKAMQTSNLGVVLFAWRCEGLPSLVMRLQAPKVS